MSDQSASVYLLSSPIFIIVAMSHNKVPEGSLVAVHGMGSVHFTSRCIKADTERCYRGLGHLAVQYSKAMGYRTVAVSSSGSKKELSLRLGADVYIDESSQDAVEELQKLGGADMIVTTAPTSAGAWKMLGGLAFEGRLVAVSLPVEPAPLSPSMCYPHIASFNAADEITRCQ